MKSVVPKYYYPLFSFVRRSDDEVEHKKYAKLLYSMYEKSSIEDIMIIYDTILERIVIKTFGKEYWNDNDWYNYDNWSNECYQMVEFLNGYLNEQIDRLSQTCSPEEYLKYYINLRQANNYSEICNDIKYKLLQSGYSLPYDVNSALPFVNHGPRNLLLSKQCGFKKLYLDRLNLLVDNGYIKSVRDRAFEAKVLLIDENKEAWNKFKNEFESKDSDLRIYLILLIFIVVFLPLLILISKLGPLGIVIILGLPGALLSFAIKGK